LEFVQMAETLFFVAWMAVAEGEARQIIGERAVGQNSTIFHLALLASHLTINCVVATGVHCFRLVVSYYRWTEKKIINNYER